MTSLQSCGVLLACFAAGTVIGSFVNVVIHRLPLGRSLWRTASACPSCGHAITWFDNVPVLAWLWLRGRCRRCRTRISAQYPIVEATCGLLTAAVVFAAMVRAGGDLLEQPHIGPRLAGRLALALTAATAGWLTTATTRPGLPRVAAWFAVAPSVAVVAWTVLAR